MKDFCAFNHARMIANLGKRFGEPVSYTPSDKTLYFSSRWGQRETMVTLSRSGRVTYNAHMDLDDTCWLLGLAQICGCTSIEEFWITSDQNP